MMGSHVLHAFAMIALRAGGARVATRAVRIVGSAMRPLSLGQARQTMGKLRAGTCLTRAMTIAARLPRSRVVIGVQPPRGGPLKAHAWVELDGAPIRTFDPSGEVIARFA